jgi:hypothetical protein
MCRPTLAWVLQIAVLALAAGAEAIEIGPGDNLQGHVNALQPGDELVLRGGTYTLGSRFSIQLTGSSESPIIIRAKAGENPVIVYPSAAQNVINVEYSRYITLAGLEVTGGSHGIRILDSDFITVESCHIHHTNDVALSANVGGSNYEGLVIRRNHIHDTNNTGEGMYLGCNYDGCRMFNSLIEGNYIHHTDGPGVSQGDGIEIKEGSHDNLVRDNVIHDTNYPCILTYSTAGNGGPNIIERNLIWGFGDHAIQSAADAVIRNNIILGAAQDGIRNQPHQSGVPSNLEITHNTVLAPSKSAIRSNSIAGSVVIANNALFAQVGNAVSVSGDTSQLTVVGNAGSGGLSGVNSGFDSSGSIGSDLTAATYSGHLPQDVFPSDRSLLAASGDPSYLAADDFNGLPRGGAADIGAYRWEAGGNPGWDLAEGFKKFPTFFLDGFESADTSAWSITHP